MLGLAGIAVRAPVRMEIIAITNLDQENRLHVAGGKLPGVIESLQKLKNRSSAVVVEIPTIDKVVRVSSEFGLDACSRRHIGE